MKVSLPSPALGFFAQSLILNFFLRQIVWPSGRGFSMATDDADCIQALTDESRYFVSMIEVWRLPFKLRSLVEEK